MKAAVLERFGDPLAITTTADPQIGTGEVLVDVLAACVLPYAAEIFSGERLYLLEPPVIPGVGGIGRVVAVASDATRLQPGDLSPIQLASPEPLKTRSTTSGLRSGQPPIDWVGAHPRQQFVGAAERTRTEEPARR